MQYIVLNTTDKERFEELKIESEFDFTKNDVRFIAFYDDWLLPYDLMTNPIFEDFKNFLVEGDHLNNGDGTPLNVQEISDEELEEFWAE